ncbi:HEAT repeat domain-containing protein [Chloroflexota bacterium]
MSRKKLIFLLIQVLTFSFIISCTAQPESLDYSNLPITVAQDTQPVQAAGWQDIRVSSVSISLEQSYDPDLKIFYSNNVLHISEYILAGLGIEVEDTSSDVNLEIILRGESLVGVYKPMEGDSDKKYTSHTGAIVDITVTLESPEGSKLEVKDSYKNVTDYIIETFSGPADTPIPESIPFALVKCFERIWGDPACVISLEYPDSWVRLAGAYQLQMKYLRDAEIYPEDKTVLALTSTFLTDQSDKVRSVAQRALLTLGPRAYHAIPILIHALEDVESTFYIKEVLIAIGQEKAAASLIDALANDNEVVCKSAIEVLGEFDPDIEGIVPALEQQLRNESITIRRVTSEALLGMGQVEEIAVPLFIKMLDDPDPKIRMDAAKFLGLAECDAGYVVPILMESLEDTHHMVACSAAESLRGLGQAAFGAIPNIINAMLRSYYNEESEEVNINHCLARALENISGSDDVATTLLNEALESEDSEIREKAAIALRDIGTGADGSVKSLIAALEDEEFHVFWQAAMALGEIGPEAIDAIPPLIESMERRSYRLTEKQIEEFSFVEVEALRKITGKDFGNDVGRWREWWEQQQ